MFAKDIYNSTNDNNEFSKDELKFLRLLAEKSPTIQAASSEIINLEAILSLPKGTEHFLTDIHGEYETFSHVLRNASGVVRHKIDEVFGKILSKKEKMQMATLIYYPEEKLEHVLRQKSDPEDWYSITLRRLVEVARAAAEKYTRSKVRKALPPDFAYIIDELLNEAHSKKKEDYYDGIIRTIIEIDRAREFIIAISNFIQRLLIDRLHIIGDIYDRGPYPEKVMDTLMAHHSVDIQWGNHDILWMGAAAGIPVCVAAVIRITARYDNLDTLEDAYGINMLPFATFTMNTYNKDNCKPFIPKGVKSDTGKQNIKLLSQIQKAAAIIETKLEGALVSRHPEFEMDHRRVLEKINWNNGSIEIDGKTHKLLDSHLPTIDKDNVYALNKEEQEAIDRLCFSFQNSEKLQRHIKFLYANGSMFLTHNSNLLFHGCIPLKKDGSFQELNIQGNLLKGKELCHTFDLIARKAFVGHKEKTKAKPFADYMWYLWSGPNSPLFGKQKMATFERYFIADKTTHKEERNSYYNYRDNEKIIELILEEFGLNPKKSHIINGHVPVKVAKGESPIKANGKLFVIDGGMSKPYQKVTGIAGYTLIYNSYSLAISEHAPFKSRQSAIEEEIDIVSVHSMIEHARNRINVGDTDVGVHIKQQIADLKKLLVAYRKGIIKMKG